MYFPSKNVITLHRRALHLRQGALNSGTHIAMESESEESDEGSEDEVPPAAAAEEGGEPAPVFRNIFEIMAQNPFIEDGSG